MPVRRLDPHSGTLEVHTYRDGVAQKIGHDLVLEVERWEASVDVGEDGRVDSVELSADPESLRVKQGRNGLKPLSDGDREDIRRSIDKQVLRGKPISFASTVVEQQDGRLTVAGKLTLGGTRRPATFELELEADRVAATLPLTQSEWGIKPYSALMGALKVRDTVEIVIDASLAPDPG